MQISNTPTNIPFKTPGEVDGQNRLQTRQELQQNSQAANGGDTLSISPEAQALNTSRNQNYDSTMTPRNRTQVMARTNAADTSDNSNDNAARLQATERQTVRMNQPEPPDTAQTTAASAAPAAPPAGRTTAPMTAATNSGENMPAETTPPAGTSPRLERSTQPEQQGNTPPTMNTMRRAAQENPVAVAGGLTPGSTTNRIA